MCAPAAFCDRSQDAVFARDLAVGNQHDDRLPALLRRMDQPHGLFHRGAHLRPAAGLDLAQPLQGPPAVLIGGGDKLLVGMRRVFDAIVEGQHA